MEINSHFGRISHLNANKNHYNNAISSEFTPSQLEYDIGMSGGDSSTMATKMEKDFHDIYTQAIEGSKRLQKASNDIDKMNGGYKTRARRADKFDLQRMHGGFY